MVFLFHCLPEQLIATVPFASNLRSCLWLGVDLFFVLSGFLISGILLRLRDAPGKYRVFYGRRVLRIFPLYYLALLVVFCLFPMLPFMAEEIDELVAAPWFLLYSFNLHMASAGWHGSNLLNHFWSLCIEEQFYLVWPFFVFALDTRRIRGFFVAAVLLSVASKFALYAMHFRWETIYLFTLSHVDSLGLGALASHLYLNRSEATSARASRGLLLSALLLLAMFFYRGGFVVYSSWSQTFVPPVFAVAAACLIYLIAIDRAPRSLGHLLETRTMGLLGKYSYGIYVYHWILYKCFVNAEIFDATVGSQVLFFLTVAGSTLLTAVLSYHLFENQFLKAKTLFPIPSGSQSATASENTSGQGS